MAWKEDDDGWFFRAWKPGEPKKNPFELGMETNDGFATNEHVFVRNLYLANKFDVKLTEFMEKKEDPANDA